MTLSVCSDSTTVSFNSWPDDDEFEDEESRVADWEVTERCDIIGNILGCYYFSI